MNSKFKSSFNSALFEIAKKLFVPSLALTALIIAFTLVPSFHPESKDAISLAISIFKNTIFGIASVVSFAVGILSITDIISKKHKVRARRIIVLTLVVVLSLFALPYIVCYAVEPVFDDYDKNFNPSVGNALEVDLNDVMFSKYSINELENNKPELKDAIIKTLESGIEQDFTNKKGYSYDDETQKVKDWEESYIWFVENNKFVINRSERFRYSEESIKHRENADCDKKTVLNQRLIAERHKDEALDYYKDGNNDKSLLQTKESIKWCMISVNTYYNYDDDIDEMKLSMNAIINSYNDIKKLHEKTDEEYRKAEFLANIYFEIANQQQID